MEVALLRVYEIGLGEGRIIRVAARELYARFAVTQEERVENRDEA